MNLVDSCGWLEYFANGPNAGVYAKPIEKNDQLLVPVICVYEVFKRVMQQRGEDQAILATARMKQGHVVDLDSSTAMRAAKLSAELKIPMADSIILATAETYQATIWTSDSDLKGIEGVRFVDRKS
ncbi:MAG: type II toxin-antitoxin system VapC family toxin [Nitrospinota bacterium]|nr:type II toxin-antitoxin system VapC family toxin [Nitrospinota bacterium]